MVIWSGKGFIVAVLVFLCSLGMEFATESFTGDSQFYQRSAWGFPAALVLAAGLTAIVCMLWIPEHERSQHTLFFIPMVWWSVVLGILASAVFVYRLVAAGPAEVALAIHRI